MRQGIVVGTWSGGQDWANLCLESLLPLYSVYPFYVVINDAVNANPEWINLLASKFNVLMLSTDNMELGAIKGIVDHTDLDEFIFFQDTIEITDCSFIVNIFENYSGLDVTYHLNHLQYYLGLWDTSILRKMEFPLPTSKKEAIEQEWRFTNKYALMKAGLPDDYKLIQGDPKAYVIDLEFDHQNIEKNYIETIFGEERLCVIGKYLIKRLSFDKENLTHSDRSYMTSEYFKGWKARYKRKDEIVNGEKTP